MRSQTGSERSIMKEPAALSSQIAKVSQTAPDSGVFIAALTPPSRLRQGRAASKGCGDLASRRGRPHPGAVGGLDDECHPLVAKDDKGLPDHSVECVVRGSGGGQLSGH